MKLLKEDFKQLLDQNALIMSLMAFIFTFIGLMIGDNHLYGTNNIYDIMRVDGSLILFIIFMIELAKTTLVLNKISKKIEFLLANGVTVTLIIQKYVISIYLSTFLIMLPSLILNVCKIDFSLLVILNLILTSFGYTLLIVILMLFLINMNKINGLQIRLILLSVIITLVSIGVYYLTNLIALYLITKLVIIGTMTAWLSLNLTKERIVASYY